MRETTRYEVSIRISLAVQCQPMYCSMSADTMTGPVVLTVSAQYAFQDTLDTLHLFVLVCLAEHWLQST